MPRSFPPSMALLLALGAPARAEPPPAQLGLCAACHQEDGRAGVPGTPRLAGQDETYLREALAAYRDGRRRHAPMQAIAGALSPRDIEQLARWFATRPPVPPP
jgi:cytochrome c553